MDPERSLIAKLAHTGQVERLIARGIDETHFVDPECANVWKFIVEHTRRYNNPPSFSVVRKRFQGYNFEVSTDALDFITDEFVSAVKNREAIKALRGLAEAMDDPNCVANIDALFLEEARRLSQLVPATLVERFSAMSKRIELWKRMQATGEMPGIPMGIPQFDSLTLGIQPHEYVSIVGWQGTGKSTLLQWVFFNAYMAGHTPMIISLEMESQALFRKWDTMATHFQYHDLKAMSLSDTEVELWEKIAEKAAKANNDILVLDDVGRCTVDRVYAEAVRYRPSIIGIDYISLMDTQRSAGSSMWEKVTYLTQALKHTARTLKIPIIGVAQTNIDSADEGARLQNISYSRSIGQDSDLVFGLHQDERQRFNKQMTVRMLKHRDGMNMDVDLLWKPETMEFEEWSPKHMFNVRHEESDGTVQQGAIPDVAADDAGDGGQLQHHTGAGDGGGVVSSFPARTTGRG